MLSLGTASLASSGITCICLPFLECKLVPETAGALADIDAACFARKSIELAALASLRELAANNTNPSSRRILLNVVSAAMAAFDLSPFTLPLLELQALVNTLANLYEGTLRAYAMPPTLGIYCLSYNTETSSYAMQLHVSFYTAHT